jgi:hypothetical protein
MFRAKFYLIILPALALWTLLLLQGYCNPVWAKEPENEKKEEQLTIPQPASFIAENLHNTKETLRNLEQTYEKNCGSLLLESISRGGNTQEIAGKLPKPKTLRFNVTYPEEKLRELSAGALSDLRNPRVMQVLGGISYFAKVYSGYVAADEETAALLNLKNRIAPTDMGFLPKISFYTLLDKFYLVSNFCGVMRRDMSGGEANVFSVPADVRGRLGVQVSAAGGATVLSSGTVVFSSPGLPSVTISGKGGLQGINPELCEGRNEWTDYVNAGQDFTRTIQFQSIKFKDFGIPGLDLNLAGAKAPFLDYFIPVKQNHNGVIANTKSRSTSAQEMFMLDILADPYMIGRISPVFVIDTGQEPQKIFEISEFPVTVRTDVKSSGPILPNGKGFLQYAGGTGASVIAWNLGKLETEQRHVQHRFTVNGVEVLPAPEMRDGRLAQGGEYPVQLTVLGEADMGEDYEVNWNVSGPAKWKESRTYFKKEGNVWSAVNTLVADVLEKWPEGLNQNVNFSASVSYVPVTGGSEQVKDVLRMLQILSPPPRQDVFSFRGSAKLALPVAEKLKLLVRHGNQAPRKMDEIDLFYPNHLTSDIRLMPYLSLREVQDPLALGDVKVPVQIEFKSTNPGAATIVTGGRLNSQALYPLETEISAKINGYANISDPKENYKMLETAGDKLISNSIWVNVNRLILSSAAQNGKTLYKLSASGSGDMSKYRALWKTAGIAGASETKTEFTKEGDAFVTTLLSGNRVNHVQIVWEDLALAQLDAKSTLAQANIVLLPTRPPAAAVGKDTGDNSDDFKSMADCVSTVARWADMWGFETGGKPETYCRQKLQAQTAEAQKQQAQNKFAEKLRQRGLDLVVFNDAMKVGAAVTGLSREFWDRTWCRWSISSESKLYLEQDMTPVRMSSEMLGGCFNVVKGIQENFDPAAMIHVELSLDTDMPNFPLFIDPDKYVGGADEFRR